MSTQTENLMTDALPEEDEISLLDLAMVVGKHKMLLLKAPLAAGVLAAGISLLMPNIYTATTKILPPQQGGGGASAMLAQLGGLAGIAGGAAGIKSPGEMYVAMIKSRTVADSLIDRFKLNEYYDKKFQSDTRKELEKNAAISAGTKDGIITIEFSDEDPKFAAEVANAYVDELYKLTNVMAVTEASQRRLFFERQMKQAKDNLDQAQLQAKQGMEQGGVSNIDVDTQVALQTSATIRAQISAKEVQIGAMRAFAADQNPQLKLAQGELASLKEQLTRIEGQRTSTSDPEADKQRFDNLQRVRDVKYNETLYSLLAKQYEMAKIDEAKDAAIVQVLDKAVEPDRKSKPKRAMMVITAMLAVGFMTLIWVFVKEALNKASSNPESAGRLAELKAQWAWKTPWNK